MVKISDKIMFLALFLIPKMVQSQCDIDYCRLIENVLNHSAFQNMPFSLVDTIYVYENGEKYFSMCDVFSKVDGKFHYVWNNSEKDWISADIKDTLLLPQKKIYQITDSCIVYRTSLLVSLSVRTGKRSMMALEDECRNHIRYRISTYKKYVSICVLWKSGFSSCVNEMISFTYKKKKKNYVLIACGIS